MFGAKRRKMQAMVGGPFGFHMHRRTSYFFKRITVGCAQYE